MKTYLRVLLALSGIAIISIAITQDVGMELGKIKKQQIIHLSSWANYFAGCYLFLVGIFGRK